MEGKKEVKKVSKVEENKQDEKDVKTKKCTVCEETKPLTDFYRGGKCKECFKAQQREHNRMLREEQAKIKTDKKLSSEPKECRKCGQIKTVGDFRVNRRECKACERAYGRNYNVEHADVRQKWHDENIDRIVELQANHYQNNKPKIRENYNKRYAKDDKFKIERNERTRLQHLVQKITCTEDYIGRKCENEMRWIEFNFDDDMNWENHGILWDVDHVIPVSKWDLLDEEQVKLCFDWKNVSPLECEKNRTDKRHKIDNEQITRHMRRLKKYFTEFKLDMKELLEYKEKIDKQLKALGETP